MPSIKAWLDTGVNMTVRIITDSGADLSNQECDDNGIVVVPLSIRFADAEYIDRETINSTEFYTKMQQSSTLPETAAPSPGRFAETYDRLADEGATEIVVLPMSETLSATGQSARTAANSYERIPVHVMDSKSVSVGLGTLALEAARAASNGARAQDILAATAKMSEGTTVVAALDTLDNLQKGGRIGKASAMLGSLLSIKPCIDLSSGSVEEAGKPRTRKKALRWLADQVPQNASHLAVGHAMADDIEYFLSLLKGHEPRMSIIGPVVGTHGGRGVIGVGFLS